MKDLFNVLSDILRYIISLRIIDIPLISLSISTTALFSYIVALIVIGFPCAFLKEVIKKEIQDEKEDKAIKYAAICLFVIFSLILLYDKATEG